MPDIWTSKSLVPTVQQNIVPGAARRSSRLLLQDLDNVCYGGADAARPGSRSRTTRPRLGGSGGGGSSSRSAVERLARVTQAPGLKLGLAPGCESGFGSIGSICFFFISTAWMWRNTGPGESSGLHRRFFVIQTPGAGRLPPVELLQTDGDLCFYCFNFMLYLRPSWCPAWLSLAVQSMCT